jgi:predicted DNA binding CopG/RHH family protein
MVKLDDEEREILRSYEAGEWVPVADKEAMIRKGREIAAATLQKDRRINIRISSNDLKALQKRAVVEGVPYQTLITSVLHKYITGRLRDRQG